MACPCPPPCLQCLFPTIPVYTTLSVPGMLPVVCTSVSPHAYSLITSSISHINIILVYSQPPPYLELPMVISMSIQESQFPISH